ncbi:hypothetical protein LCGC14_3075760 [marine sediment metagenome]|uniref:Methyltransferase type 11 domain-containing protein n=1 Tax=marine sediment metagenome TaxID=412755 RepID=A0A0F8WFE8_9ZZZZ
MSFFSLERVAQGYANCRPYFHPLVMQKIRQYIGLEGKASNALDVGCGSGLSTLALKELAEQVAGIDNSQEMIAVAETVQDDSIAYYHSPAENLPFDNELFDLITVCGALNWIDRTRFFPEAIRVLKEQGWLIVYDNSITEHMRENSEYTAWYQEQYLSRYPKPPRDERPLTQSECELCGLHFANSEQYTNEVALSLDEYIAFTLTQSNVIAATDMDSKKLAEAKKWMQATLEPVIPGDKGTFLFRGYIWYLHRAVG